MMFDIIFINGFIACGVDLNASNINLFIIDLPFDVLITVLINLKNSFQVN